MDLLQGFSAKAKTMTLKINDENRDDETSSEVEGHLEPSTYPCVTESLVLKLGKIRFETLAQDFL